MIVGCACSSTGTTTTGTGTAPPPCRCSCRYCTGLAKRARLTPHYRHGTGIPCNIACAPCKAYVAIAVTNATGMIVQYTLPGTTIVGACLGHRGITYLHISPVLQFSSPTPGSAPAREWKHAQLCSPRCTHSWALRCSVGVVKRVYVPCRQARVDALDASRRRNGAFLRTRPKDFLLVLIPHRNFYILNAPTPNKIL